MKSARIKPLIFLALALGGWHMHAFAEGLRIEPNVAATLLWTDNSNLGLSSVKRDDLVVDVKPSLHITLGDPHLRIQGDIGLTSTNYANSTQPNRTAPLAELTLNSILVDRLFFFDASLRSAQSNQNLFGVLTDTGTTVNTYTSTQIGLSPYIERELTRALKLNVRSDNTWTKNNGATVEINDGYYGKHVGSLTLLPEPLGGALEVQRSVSTYQNTNDQLTRDLGRLTLTGAFDAQFQISALIGTERTDFGAARTKESGEIYGGRFKWRPGERTNLQVTLERWFFGNAWDASFTHRSPFVAWNISAIRQLSSFTERLFSAPPGSNLDALLNSAFTTRFPDPAERERAVRDFLAQRGLPGSSQGALNIYTNRLDLSTSASANVALIGIRNSATLTLFQSRTESAPGLAGASPQVLPADVRQFGGSFNWSYRTSELSAVVLAAAISESNGLGINSGLHSRQQTYRLEYSETLSKQTTGILGLRRRMYDSTISAGGTEFGGFVSANHRF